MDFIALDVETANPNLASICQIGLVIFSDGEIIQQWETFINPEDYFAPQNVSIHGITEEMVRDAPIFQQVSEHLSGVIAKKIVATHTPFDKVAINRAFERYQLPPVECMWVDTARVARRAWSQFASSGYGLANVANELGIDFEHHVAINDARVAGEILLRAVEQTEIGLDEWLIKAYQPISSRTQSKISRDGNQEGELAGEVIVFTGALSMPRRQAAEWAAEAGCDIRNTVNKKTTLLVVGNQDIRRLEGHKKSSKQRKAEQLISTGQPIRILGEGDFLSIIGRQVAS